MEFNYLVEKKRMLHNLGCILPKVDICNGLKCNKCLLSKFKSGHDLSCIDLELKYQVEATEIVRKWANEHPRKTRKDVLFEKFPKAEICKDGSPYSCCSALGMIPKEQCNENCTKCWDTEVEE